MEIISRKNAISQNLKRYFTGKPCNKNHISERLVSNRGCIECNSINSTKYLKTEYGKEKKIQKQKRYVKKNYSKILERDRKRTKTPQYKERVKQYNQREYVKEKKSLYNKAYREKYLEKLKENDRKYRKEVRSKDPDYKLKENIRRRILIAISNQNTTKRNTIIELMGCSVKKYRDNLEKQFYPHPKTKKMMTWGNHGLKGWHIDHIKPLAKFNLKKLSEQKKAFNYKNTQPLWWFENLKKGSG